ncbi:hypothetical protein Vretimale_5137 [Volvox reticuliferus]|uniref:Uncharacterized protein n=1 Tax=Volvox reticuliferus TaxID=1737510 RepID=A0A8J4C8G2_9CHLO|nr:hypothetical protein Vretifemale_4024 [Volvox reticuliferus]GIM00065.1 hypothetical protein Vretimale_5137 [Volvox reticuliferus]
MPSVGRSGTKPKSLVEHLTDQAPKRPVNDIVSLDRYLMSAQLLVKQADDYRHISDEEQLYVMLLRFASLVVETIPTHRDFRENNTSYKALKKDLLLRYLPELERLKASLRLKDRTEPPTATSRNRPTDAVQLSISALPQLDWASSGAPPAPPPPHPASLAEGPAPAALNVDDLLEVMSSAPPSAPPPPPPPAGPSSAAPTDPYALAAAVTSSLSASSSALEAAQLPKYAHSYAASSSDRHALFGSPPVASSSRRVESQQRGPGGLPRYPLLDMGPAALSAEESPQLSSSPGGGLEQLQQQMAMATLHPTSGPSLGPQEVQVSQLLASTSGLPDTCRIAHGAPSPAPAAPPLPSTAAATSPLSGGPKELPKLAQLRDVHVSVALMEEFLHYARTNTSRGIESCGILAGRLLAGDSTFAITTLIIPKQQGTSDTVQALNEEEIFEAQFSRELYPMGWIHTHPTQTCFLSSVDVHTQCGYQTMLEEAVAIVMAPTDLSKKCGIFRLSTPGGLSLVQKCPQRGFHMHPPTDTGQELYELCGHVFLNPRTRHEVLDLR